MEKFYYKADMPLLSEEEQMELSRSRSIGERVHLARRQDLCKKVAMILAKDSETKVRFELAIWTNQKDIWKILVKKDVCPKVRKYAHKNHNFGRKNIFI